MKIYNLCKRYISIFLAILIFVISFYQSYFISYANSNVDKPNIGWEIGKDVLSWLEDAGSYSMWFGTQVGAVFTLDYEKWLQNNETLKNYWKNKYITSSDNTDENQDNYITINQYTNEINFSEDFIRDFKQSLKEYSEETNGYWLMPTTSIKALNPQLFTNQKAYISMQQIINNEGIIVCQTTGSTSGSVHQYDGFLAADFSEYISSNYSLVCINGSGYDPNDTDSSMVINIYDDEWTKVDGIIKYTFTSDEIHTHISEGTEFSLGYKYSNLYVDYPRYHNGNLFCCNTHVNNYYQGYGLIISKDGCRIRVFKSVNAMKGYDTGTRTVYFTEKFYINDSQSITVSFDEFENIIDKKYDQYIDDLRGLIADSGSNLTEAELEKLTAQVLGKLDQNNGLLQEGNQITSYWLERIYKELVAIDEMMADKFDSILEYLKKISNWTIADTVVDGVGIVGDAVDFIKDLISDAEGVADNALGTLLNALDGGTSLLSKKFPFSVPWDLLFFITLLASEPEVPHFEIPIDFDISALAISLHYDFVIDFTEYQFLSDISRTILSMTYCVGLIKFTSGVVSIKKEE